MIHSFKAAGLVASVPLIHPKSVPIWLDGDRSVPIAREAPEKCPLPRDLGTPSATRQATAVSMDSRYFCHAPPPTGRRPLRPASAPSCSGGAGRSQTGLERMQPREALARPLSVPARVPPAPRTLPPLGAVLTLAGDPRTGFFSTSPAALHRAFSAVDRDWHE